MENDFSIRIRNLEAEQEMRKLRERKRMLIGLLGFLGMMLILTFVSRAIYSEGLPKVKWSYPASRALQQKIQTEGVLGANSPEMIYGLEKLRISRICVSEGEQFEADAVLYEIDTNDLQKQLAEIRAEYSTWWGRAQAWYEDARTDTAWYEAGQKETQIAALQELLDQEGKVRAPESGMVLEILAKPGHRMEDTPIIYYINESTELIFEGVIDASLKALVHVGDQVTITFARSRKETESVIDWIEEQNGSYLVRGRLQDMEGQGELEGTMEIFYTSPVYDYVIPQEALHTEGEERCCVYLLKEKNGILGTELSVEKCDVRVLEQSETHAAIMEEVLGKDTKIIVSSDKELVDGMTVREKP